jgi:TonB family protein
MGAERSREEIMQVVETNTPALKSIYNQYLKQKPGFSGKVVLKFTIAPSGEIIKISIESSTTGYSKFDKAIKDKVATWKWKAIEAGNITPIIPFNFTEDESWDI